MKVVRALRHTRRGRPHYDLHGTWAHPTLEALCEFYRRFFPESEPVIVNVEIREVPLKALEEVDGHGV